MFIHKPRFLNIISYSLFLISAGMIVVVVLLTRNMQVLANWKLTLPTGPIRVGDTIVVASTYTKLRQVTGSSTRTIECAYGKGIYISTPLDKAIANRAPGKTGTGIVVKIPAALTGVKALPDPCHICVSISYPVLPLRTVSYFKCTKDFNLLPAVAPATVSSAAIRTSPVQVSLPSHTSSQSADGSMSSSNSSSDTTPSQSNFEQPAAPSLVNRAFSGIRHIIDSVL